MRISELYQEASSPGRKKAETWYGKEHDVWVNPANGNRAGISRHQNQEISDDLLRKILRDLGFSRDEFERRG